MIAPNIIQVVPRSDYTAYVYFADGKIVCYDVKPMLNGEVFKPLNNIDFFISRCSIINDTLSWDLTGDRNPYKCLDIDPETLYSLPAVKDFLEEESIA